MAKRSKKKRKEGEGKSKPTPAPVDVPMVAPVVAPMTSSQTSTRPGRDWILGLSLMLMVLLVYHPAWNAGLVWDDEPVVTLNPVISGPYGVKEIWTSSAADICPLTLTTFWAEYKLWGAAPLPYHLVNIFLHGACAVLFWQVLRHLRIPGAWLGAALWALHPVEVESVAWITEMKNTESGLFFLLSILFFVKDIDAGQSGNRSGWSWNYAFALLFAALAMASKSSTVVLPLVLCLGIWWMEGRWEWRKLVKVAPLFVMSIVAGLVTIWTQKLLVATLPEAQWNRSWMERVATAGDTIWFYLGKIFCPYPLMTIYPRWNIDAGQVMAYLPLWGVIVVLLIFWFNRESWARPWFFAYAFFLVTLLPIVGLLNNTFFRFSFVADHFQYLASMGPLAMAGAGIVRLGKARLQSAIGAGILALLGILSWQQASIYKNQLTLWHYTLAWNPNCWLAENGLGVTLVAEGKSPEAITHYQQALKLNPNYTDAHYNLGVALTNEGRADEALAQYRAVLSINPNFAKADDNIGYLLGQRGQTDEAITHFRRALQSDPVYAEAHYNLAVALFHKGNRDEATAELRNAIRCKQDYVGAYNSLGVAYAQMGKLEDSLAQFRKVLEFNPNDPDAHNNLGIVLSQAGRLDQALAEFKTAYTIKPSSSTARNMGTLFQQLGRLPEAANEFREALRLDPSDAQAQKSLADVQRQMKQGGNRK